MDISNDGISPRLNPQRVLKLLVVDSWGSSNVPYLKERFPNARFRALKTRYRTGGLKQNLHGYAVAYCALTQVDVNKRVDVDFLRVFDGNGRPYSGYHSWVDMVRLGSYDAVCCSFGRHHHNSVREIRALDRLYSTNYATKMNRAFEECGCVCFAAAGNEDSSRRGVELGNDVNYPWKTCNSTNLCIVGAVDNRSYPAGFSSDGPEVDIAFLGVDVPCLTPAGDYALMDGTSFAAPLAAGYYLDRLGKNFSNFAEFDKHCSKFAYRAEGWDKTKKHPKVGWGSMLEYQRELPYEGSGLKLSEWGKKL